MDPTTLSPEPARIAPRHLASRAAILIATVVLALTHPDPAATDGVRGAIPYAVIVSPDVKFGDLKLADVRSLLMSRRTHWPDGRPVVVVLPPPGGATRGFFLREIARTDEETFRRRVLALIRKGDLDYPPKVADSDAAAIEFVNAGRGAIALVPAAARGRRSATAVAVDGRKPGAAGYPLQDLP